MSILNFFRKKEMAEMQATNVETPEGAAQEEMSEAESKPEADAKACASEGKKRVHNLIILDESGSMMSIYRPALTGVNETLQTIREAQKEHKDQEHFVTLAAFDTGHYNRIYAHVPAAMATDISEEQYRPCGGTPLFDAMGRGLTELRPNVAKGDVVLVTIITDGYENASREFSGKAIKALVESLKSQGWVFTYIGANQDVEAVASSISIDNHLAFETNDRSTGEMFAKERNSRMRFFNKISCNMSMDSLSTDYFDDDADDDADENPNEGQR